MQNIHCKYVSEFKKKMKAFHSMTSNLANTHSFLSGLVWALSPETRKKLLKCWHLYINLHGTQLTC